MAMTPPVTLLLPNLDNAAVLDLVLDRLAVNSTYPNLELVVVDDGSTDGSLEILRRWRDSGRLPEFRLIEQERAGVIEALNKGLDASTGEFVVQLDGDASVESPGWIEKMVAFFETDARVGVVTSKVVFDWGTIHTCGVDVIGPTGFRGRGASITERVGRRRYHERVVHPEEDDCALCDAVAEVDGGMGACMMYRREAALEVGGYDPGWAPVWFDDLDLTICLRREGQKVFYLPDVRVVHHVGRRLTLEPAVMRARLAVRRAIGSALPPHTRRRISQRLGMDLPHAEAWARLQHHYGYWREKWGFDLLNPDMDAVLERWGGTEVCWRYDEHMRAEGERIVAAYRARA